LTSVDESIPASPPFGFWRGLPHEIAANKTTDRPRRRVEFETIFLIFLLLKQFRDQLMRGPIRSNNPSSAPPSAHDPEIDPGFRTIRGAEVAIASIQFTQAKPGFADLASRLFGHGQWPVTRITHRSSVSASDTDLRSDLGRCRVEPLRDLLEW